MIKEPEYSQEYKSAVDAAPEEARDEKKTDKRREGVKTTRTSKLNKSANTNELTPANNLDQKKAGHLEEKIKQKDLYISSLHAEISSLQAQKAALVGDDLEKKALYEIREQIRLLREELKKREEQTLFQIFGKETDDQLDMVARQYDYFDESYKRMQAQARRISELESSTDQALAKQYQDLRATVDSATALACQRQEEIETLKKQLEQAQHSTTQEDSHQQEHHSQEYWEQTPDERAELHPIARARIEKLTRERDQAISAATDMREFARQIQAHRDSKLNEYEQANHRLEQENANFIAQIEMLTAQLADANQAEVQIVSLSLELSQVRAERDQAQKQAMPTLLTNIAELEQKLASLQPKKLRAQVEDLQAQTKSLETERDQAMHVAEEALAELKTVEHEWQEKHAQAQAQAEQNAHIAEEEHAQVITLLAENTDLRTELAEQDTSLPKRGGVVLEWQETRASLAEQSEFHHDEISCQECIRKDQRISNQQTIIQIYRDAENKREQQDAWLKRVWRNKEIEANSKAGALAFLWLQEKRQDAQGYTSVDLESYGDMFGVSRQTAGRVARDYVSIGAWSKIEEKEKCTVPDKRRGQREIEKTHYHFAPTKLFEQNPEDLHKPDGKSKQGGSLPRCKQCNAENTLKRIYHTICTVCGFEDIYYDDEALLIRNRTQHESTIEAEDAPRAVAEVERLMQTTAPASDPVIEVESTVVQDEQQYASAPQTALSADDEIDPDIETARRVLEKMVKHGCSLSYNDEGHGTYNVPATWNTQQIEGLQALLIKYHREIRALHDEYPALVPQPAAPAPWDRPCDWCDGIETVYDPDGSGRRVCACFIYPERRKPQAWERPSESHKTVNFASGQIMEVES